MAFFLRKKEGSAEDTKKNIQEGIILREEMQGLSSLTRRRFLQLSALTAGAAAVGIPFQADAQHDDLIIVTVTGIDETRESFGAIVENYCDPNDLVKFYGTKSYQMALGKLALFNGLKPPTFIVQENDEMKIPNVLLKDSIRKKIKKTGDKWPLKVQGDLVLVTVTAKDQQRNSLNAIMSHYVHPETLLRFYGTSKTTEAMQKLARFNGLQPPKYIVKEGQIITLPQVITKREIWRDYDDIDDRIKEGHEDKERETAHRSVFQSPFGGTRKPPTHQCFTGTGQNSGAGSRRICPFDTFTARRGGGRRHNSLDVHSPIGTPLFPLKPGTVIGAGYYYLDAGGQKRKFQFWPNNGNAVKIQSGDWVVMYIHLKRVFVNIGQKVDYGSCVGELGITGNASAANPHVHITMTYKGALVDPLKFLKFLQ